MDRRKKNPISLNAVWNQPEGNFGDETVAENEQSNSPKSANILSSQADSSTPEISTQKQGSNLQRRFGRYNPSEYSTVNQDNEGKSFHPTRRNESRSKEFIKNPKKYHDDNQQKPNKGSNFNREVRPMSFTAISNLYKKEDANEVLLTILNKDSGFSLILEKNDISRDFMACVLLALGKGVTSHLRSNVNAMINLVTSSDISFFKKTTIFLVSLQKLRPDEQYHLKSLVSLSDFLYQFQLAMQSAASDPLLEILPLLQRTCELCLVDHKELYDKALKNLQEIDKRNRIFLEEYTQKEVKHVPPREKLHLQAPPENYRSIPVLPTIDDVNSSCPFLRPNLVKGQYQDAEHYLDVQYRLLREDYVKPLRDGIAEYLMLKKQGKSSKHCRDVKVYENVHIIKTEFGPNGVVHFARFSDENFAKIKWEYNKRFLTGSLLCLSSDDFKTMLFATVARRDPKELCKGLLLLQFDGLTSEVLALNPLRGFVVIETSSYFEAYRYNLHALRELDESTLPMKPYIVEVQKSVQRPKYLKESVTYDMRPLLIPLDDEYITFTTDGDDEILTTYEFPHEISRKAKSVEILKDHHWPSCSELNLDPTQYAAIKAAVTKEFAIIQGPPGTGKTHVGLRIAQLLLHNVDKWRCKTDPSPILVVCYTNHALDQFLEGLLLFTQQIVRIGGRGKNEALSQFQLNNLKRIMEERREVPKHIFKNIRQKRFEVSQLSKQISLVYKSVENCYSNVLSENLLKDSMPDRHYKSLKGMCHLEDDGCIIRDWLGIRLRPGDLGPEVGREFQGSEEERVQNIVAFLKNTKACKEEEVQKIEDIWYLSFVERCRLYKFWLERYIAENVILEEYYETVLSENILKDSMLSKHYKSLTKLSFRDDGFKICDWLSGHVKAKQFISSDSKARGSEERRQYCFSTGLYSVKAMTEREVNAIENVWLTPMKYRCQLYKYWLECFVRKKHKDTFEALCSSVLCENTLSSSMSEIHYETLKNKLSIIDNEYIIHNWLHIYNDEFKGSVGEGNAEVPTYMKTQKAASPEELANLEEDVDGGADIEFIEAQRDINPEEFAGISCDVPLNENEIFFSEVKGGGWQIPGGKKKLKQFIFNHLRKVKAMVETEVKDVENIWHLPLTQRWRLYKFWLECHIAKRQTEVFKMQKQFRKEYEEFIEIQNEVDLNICLKAHVVGMTTTGAAKYRNIVQHLNPKIVIVEEAAEILESHIVTSLAPNTQHVILIGDHQQLKPNPTVYALAVQYKLSVSLFERMVQNGMECYRLGTQHRMRPEISALLVPHIYKDLKNHQSVMEFEVIKGVSKNVFFITHNHNELQELDSKSKVNQHEATFLIRLCWYILLQGYEPSQITVLTTYLGQLFALKKLVGGGLLKDVKFTVVDNYQGEENDIILISFVRSNEEGEIGFLKVSNRVCVALSRAKKGLYCIGNFEMLMHKSPLWKSIVNVLQKNQAIGTSLQLCCQNHPTVKNVVACGKDFDAVREGGCSRTCEFLLPCKHSCSSMCHPYDMEHLTIKCRQPCTKTCSNGHSCTKLCSEKCGPCTELVDKKLSSCGHIIKVGCDLKNYDALCTKPCEKPLPCGHKCLNTCSVACEANCRQSVNILSPLCGHVLVIECCYSSKLKYLLNACNAPCRVELSCGHTCKGTCSRCHQGRLHVLCNQPCKRKLVCGHECKSLCSKSCPPCRQSCENRCFHGKCSNKCGEPCERCTEPCKWLCLHKKCTRLCFEPCNRTACNEPCPKILKCKHPCIGLCGEPCPKECRICDKDIVTDIFFGMEDEEDARFIYLEDCKHIIGISRLTQWMKQFSQEKQEIQMPVCPKCEVVIRRNLHFGNIVKSCLSDIEKVKEVVYGDTNDNLRLLQKAKSKSNNFLLLCNPLLRTLRSPKNRSKTEATVIENVICLADELEQATDFFNYKIHLSSIAVSPTAYKLLLYMKPSKELLLDFMQNEYLTASEWQLRELGWEIFRLKLADKLLRFLCEYRTVNRISYLTNLMESIISYGPFRESDANKCRTEFEALSKLCGETLIKISDFEKKIILKAISFSKGQCYLCPNGHAYCVPEYERSSGESHCNECKA